MINVMTNDELINIWRNGNAAGRGYSIGGPDDSPEIVAELDCMDEIRVLDPEGSVAALDGIGLVVIRDHNGPWAVRVQDGETY